MDASSLNAIVASSASGSAAGTTFKKVFGVSRMVDRQKGKVPKGRQPGYWQCVYALVERFWLDLQIEDRYSWKLGRLPKGMTARDYFGSINMRLVGYCGCWAKRRPSRYFTKGTREVVSEYKALPLCDLDKVDAKGDNVIECIP